MPTQHVDLGDLVAIDGSFIDSALSMDWAEYKTNSNKAKLHLGFDLNHGIPRKLFLNEGKGAERPFVGSIIAPGETAVLDRGYQAHSLFTQWQKNNCHFICRIKGKTFHHILRVRQLRNQIRNETREQAGKEAVLRKTSQRKRKWIKKPHAIF